MRLLQVVQCLLRYSINGQFLDRLKLAVDDNQHTISTQLVTAQDYLIYGTLEGKLYIREIHRYEPHNVNCFIHLGMDEYEGVGECTNYLYLCLIKQI